MRPPGSVTVTRVRRCAEEAKGGLELAWSFGVASAFQRLCEESASKSGSSRFDAEVVGHTTPAVADVGRGSLRVRFLRSHKRDGIVGDQADGRDEKAGRDPFPTGGLLLGVRRTVPSSSREEPRTTFDTVSADRATREVEPSAYRFLPAIAAAPGARGPDRHGNSRDGLAELVVMARPLATEETLSRRDDVAESEKVGGGEGKRFQKKPRDANRIDARDMFVTSLDDASLRSWLPVGAKADIVVLRRVTGFHLGLNANRWLKIRMREIADGVAGLAFLDRDEKTEDKTNVSASPASFYRGTGLVLDPSGVINDAPVGASYEFEHWGAGGNTGVSGQVTVW
jgi:hypothetical protein